jgi:60S ribosomal subunit assembly/export protein LOC1
MAPSRTRTIKNKHAASKSSTGGGKGSKPGPSDRVVKSKRQGPAPPVKQVKGKGLASLLGKKKKKVYTEKELGIPTLNMVTPVGVEKPKGKKKGKVFVDDKVRTILFPLASSQE